MFNNKELNFVKRGNETIVRENYRLNGANKTLEEKYNEMKDYYVSLITEVHNITNILEEAKKETLNESVNVLKSVFSIQQKVEDLHVRMNIIENIEDRK